VRTLTPAQARLLAEHVGVLLLSNLVIDERIAACLGTHEGGVLSLRGLESVSGRGLALLWDNPDVILPPKLAGPAAATAAQRMRPGGHPSPAELERIIAAIAAAGEAQLA
jgi:hypothetical protein